MKASVEVGRSGGKWGDRNNVGSFRVLHPPPLPLSASNGDIDMVLRLGHKAIFCGKVGRKIMFRHII